MKRSMLGVCAGALVFGSAGMAVADEEPHADMLLSINPDGRLVSGVFDFDEGKILSLSQRVYEAEFDEFGTTDEPGFNAVTQGNLPGGFTALPGNQSVTFNAPSFSVEGVEANLFYWDAVGDTVNFQPSGTMLNVSKAPNNIFSVDLDGSANDVDGFEIESTAGDGFLHKHIDFSLADGAGSAEGIYLWAFTVHVGDDLTTEPVFFVHAFGNIDEEQHELAAEFVEANVVPGPGVVPALLAASAGAMSLRKRRN